MTNHYKTIFWGFLTLDYKAVQGYLEEMALKGYELVSIHTKLPFAKFKKVTPQKIRFYVDIFAQEEQGSYLGLCEDSGWQFICSKGLMKIFKAKENCDPIPIQTDVETERKIVQSAVINKEILPLIILLPLMFFFLNDYLYGFDYKVLLSYTQTMMLFLAPVFIGFTVLSTLYLLCYILKARKAVKEERSLPVPSIRSAKLRGYLFYTYTVIILITVIFSFIGEFGNAPYIVLIALAPGLVGILAGLSLKKLRKRIDKKQRVKKIVLVCIVSIIAFSVLMVLTLMGISYLSISDHESPENRYRAANSPVLMLQDFYGEVGNDYRYSSFRESKSPFVKEYYNYYEGIRDVGRISTEYYKAANPFVAGIIYEGIVEENAKYESQNIEAKVFEADKVMYFSKLNMLLISKDEVVLFLEGDIDFFTEKSKDVIKETLAGQGKLEE